jgi:alpha-tubulin suppressor-like RCC1 family protein
MMSQGSLSQRKRSTAEEDQSSSPPVIKDIKMGEQFTIAVSFKGYVYTWGMNDKGQLGIGNEAPTFEPIQLPQIGPGNKYQIKPVTKIACGLKHCLVLTNNDKLFAWGSNL